MENFADKLEGTQRSKSESARIFFQILIRIKIELIEGDPYKSKKNPCKPAIIRRIRVLLKHRRSTIQLSALQTFASHYL